MEYKKYGIVNRKSRLCAVYSKPSVLSRVLVKLIPGDLVKIDSDNSTECYYKVLTETNDVGYIMQNNIDTEGGD